MAKSKPRSRPRALLWTLSAACCGLIVFLLRPAGGYGWCALEWGWDPGLAALYYGLGAEDDPGLRQPNSRFAITYVNGIYHTREDWERLTTQLQGMFEHRVRPFYNPTSGWWLADASRAGYHLMRRPADDEVVRGLAGHLQQALADVGPRGRVLHLAHSGGALLTYLAAKHHLASDETARIDVLAFGGARSITRKYFGGRTVNYYARNDPLVFVDRRAAGLMKHAVNQTYQEVMYAKHNTTFVFLAGRANNALVDHSLEGPTYMAALEREAAFYRRRYFGSPGPLTTWGYDMSPLRRLRKLLARQSGLHHLLDGSAGLRAARKRAAAATGLHGFFSGKPRLPLPSAPLAAAAAVSPSSATAAAGGGAAAGRSRVRTWVEFHLPGRRAAARMIKAEEAVAAAAAAAAELAAAKAAAVAAADSTPNFWQRVLRIQAGLGVGSSGGGRGDGNESSDSAESDADAVGGGVGGGDDGDDDDGGDDGGGSGWVGTSATTLRQMWPWPLDGQPPPQPPAAVDVEATAASADAIEETVTSAAGAEAPSEATAHPAAVRQPSLEADQAKTCAPPAESSGKAGEPADAAVEASEASEAAEAGLPSRGGSVSQPPQLSNLPVEEEMADPPSQAALPLLQAPRMAKWRYWPLLQGSGSKSSVEGNSSSGGGGSSSSNGGDSSDGGCYADGDGSDAAVASSVVSDGAALASRADSQAPCGGSAQLPEMPPQGASATLPAAAEAAQEPRGDRPAGDEPTRTPPEPPPTTGEEKSAVGAELEEA